MAGLALRRRSFALEEIRLLYTLDVCFLLLEFFIVLPYLIHGELSIQAVKDSLQLIFGGPFTLVFWVFFLGLGLLAPLAIEAWEIAPAVMCKAAFHSSKRLAAAAAILVLVGGFLLRYIFVYAGQMSAFK